MRASWEGKGGDRDGPGTCPPPSGKSSVSSSTTWKPLSTSFLPLLPSVCSSAGRQETTVVVNWVETDAKVSPDPNPQRTGLNPARRPLHTAPPRPAQPHPLEAAGFPPRKPHLSGVAVPLTQKRHRCCLPGRGDARSLKCPAADGEQSGTIFTPGASLRRRSRAKNGMRFEQIYSKRDVQALGIV